MSIISTYLGEKRNESPWVKRENYTAGDQQASTQNLHEKKTPKENKGDVLLVRLS